MSSIRISEKHGFNPMLVVCFYCQKDRGDIALFGRLPGDAEAPRRGVIAMDPCDECKGYMKQGIILISYDEAKTTDKKNPYRSGGWCVLKEEAVKRMFKEGELLDAVLKCRFAFMDDQTWDHIGLPRGASPSPTD